MVVKSAWFLAPYAAFFLFRSPQLRFPMELLNLGSGFFYKTVELLTSIGFLLQAQPSDRDFKCSVHCSLKYITATALEQNIIFILATLYS